MALGGGRPVAELPGGVPVQARRAVLALQLTEDAAVVGAAVGWVGDVLAGVAARAGQRAWRCRGLASDDSRGNGPPRGSLM